MYVRTKKGEIFECYESEQMHKPIYYPKKSKTKGYIDYGDVYKKSNNIIDILEVGDYVNGYKVDFTNIENKLTYEEKNIGFYDGDGDITLFENDIKSIVTKEIFSSIEYEVKQ